MYPAKEDIIAKLKDITLEFLPQGNNLADFIDGVNIGDKVRLSFALPIPIQGSNSNLKDEITAICQQMFGKTTECSYRCKISRHQVQPGLAPRLDVKNIIAVVSGKGGVGKSLAAVTLARSLHNLGAKVAICDLDIYGPSLGQMVGINNPQVKTENKKFHPVVVDGIQTMSIGYLVDDSQAMIWRGPMASGAVKQLINDTMWEPCDFLILDLPPGTGDIQLTLGQKIPISGAVVVTTPQDMSLIDVKRACKMLTKLQIPTLGIIENMSHFVCPNCHHHSHIFGANGGQKLAELTGYDLLGSIPLNSNLQELCDNGKAFEILDNIAYNNNFYNLANAVSWQLSRRGTALSQVQVGKIAVTT